MDATNGPADVSTRERILAAAAECFAKDGYQRARMVAVAERAGVSRAGLYLHFPTKEALLAGLNERVIDEWLALSERTLSAEGSALEAIGSWIREGLASEAQLSGVRVVTADETQRALLLDRKATEEALDQTLRMLASVLRRGVRSAELARDLDVFATAHGLQAMLLGLLRNHVSERPLVDVRDERHIAAIVSLTTRGIARQGGRLERQPTRSEPQASGGGPLHGQGGRLERQPTRSERKPSGAQRGEAERRSDGQASEGGPLHELAD